MDYPYTFKGNYEYNKVYKNREIINDKILSFYIELDRIYKIILDSNLFTDFILDDVLYNECVYREEDLKSFSPSNKESETFLVNNKDDLKEIKNILHNKKIDLNLVKDSSLRLEFKKTVSILNRKDLFQFVNENYDNVETIINHKKCKQIINKIINYPLLLSTAFHLNTSNNEKINKITTKNREELLIIHIIIHIATVINYGFYFNRTHNNYI